MKEFENGVVFRYIYDQPQLYRLNGEELAVIVPTSTNHWIIWFFDQYERDRWRKLSSIKYDTQDEAKSALVSALEDAGMWFAPERLTNFL